MYNIVIQNPIFKYLKQNAENKQCGIMKYVLSEIWSVMFHVWVYSWLLYDLEFLPQDLWAFILKHD